jgi:uncharacterized cupin superfamily protein
VPESFNLLSGELQPGFDRPGYTWQTAKLGAALGASMIGGSLYELDAGEKTFPFHFHYGMEEWLLVVDGTPTLRTPEGERELAPGDVVCFPDGPEGGHQVSGPGRVLMLSRNDGPIGAAEYTDSGKLGVRPPGKVFRMDDATDYWEGE